MQMVMRTSPGRSRVTFSGPALAALLALPLALLFVGQSAAHAASYTFPIFSLTANDIDNISSLALTGAPAGTTFNSYSVSMDWTAGDGGPYSQEAFWTLASDTPAAASPTYYADPGPSPDSAASSDPVTLTWSGFFDTSYVGGNPLYFWYYQSFTGSNANWSNISLTLNTDTPTPPAATPLNIPSTATTSLAARGIAWYSLDYAGGYLAIDTLGTLLNQDNDTEIALYDANGHLVATNNDIDASKGNLLSSLAFADGDLATGMYYVAAGAFDSTFEENFAATSESTSTGTLQLNIRNVPVSVVPEPGMLAPFVLAGSLPVLGAIIRRRRYSS